MNIEKQPPICVICNQPMKLISTLKTTPRRSYRIRTYYCSLCNYSERKYADGKIDQINIDSTIQKASKL